MLSGIGTVSHPVCLAPIHLFSENEEKRQKIFILKSEDN